MTSQHITPRITENEIDLPELLRLIWNRRRLIIASIGLSLLAAISYLHIAEYKYTATLTVAPVDISGDGLSGKLGGLAGLASAAGVNFPTDLGGTYFQLYSEGYKTQEVARVLSNDTYIMQEIFRKEWSDQTQKFQEPPSVLRPISNAVKTILGVPVFAWREPNAARLKKYIDENVVIFQDRKLPLIKITYKDINPAFAPYFLQKLHEAADNQLRMRAKTRAEESIVYLSRQLSTVTLAEHRAAIAQSLSEQEKIRMMANSKMSFTAEPLESPVISARPTNPIPFVVIAVAFILGLVSGFSVIILQIQLETRKHIGGHLNIASL